jgi:hypothetical protein
MDATSMRRPGQLNVYLLPEVSAPPEINAREVGQGWRVARTMSRNNAEGGPERRGPKAGSLEPKDRAG